MDNLFLILGGVLLGGFIWHLFQLQRNTRSRRVQQELLGP